MSQENDSLVHIGIYSYDKNIDKLIISWVDCFLSGSMGTLSFGSNEILKKWLQNGAFDHWHCSKSPHVNSNRLNIANTWWMGFVSDYVRTFLGFTFIARFRQSTLHVVQMIAVYCLLHIYCRTSTTCTQNEKKQSRFRFCRGVETALENCLWFVCWHWPTTLPKSLLKTFRPGAKKRQ